MKIADTRCSLFFLLCQNDCGAVWVMPCNICVSMLAIIKANVNRLSYSIIYKYRLANITKQFSDKQPERRRYEFSLVEAEHYGKYVAHEWHPRCYGKQRSPFIHTCFLLYDAFVLDSEISFQPLQFAEPSHAVAYESSHPVAECCDDNNSHGAASCGHKAHEHDVGTEWKYSGGEQRTDKHACVSPLEKYVL